MSIALRIFIVLTLVLSLAFAWVQMSLYVNRENWRRRWNEDTKELALRLKEATGQIATESAAKVRAENAAVAREGDIVRYQAQIKALEDQITERAQKIQNLERDLARAQQDYTALKEDYGAAQKSLDMVRQRNTELTSIAQIARATAFNLNVKLAEVEDDLNNLQTEMGKRSEDLEKIRDELRQSNAFVAQVREKFPKIYDVVRGEKGGTTKVLRAAVAAITNDQTGKQDIIMLSIGADDGVEEGQEFVVFRNDQYICKVRVERPMADMSPARVLPESWNDKGLKIERGDTAQNRL
jgi:predicted RNase H-like nuclease (RuvC/YqgF family)